MTPRTALAALLLCGCSVPNDGTFVGNPTLTTRFEGNDVQLARGGMLVASRIVLDSCDASQTLDGTSFAFTDGRSNDRLAIPPGDYCGVEFEVAQLIIGFEEAGEETTVIAEGFLLEVYTPFSAVRNGQNNLTLGSPTWLADLAMITTPGENVVEDGALLETFYDGLADSTVATEEAPSGQPDAPTLDPDVELAGRVTIADHPTSPLGSPTTTNGCGENAPVLMAAPIPSASMATLDVFDARPGWCEGEVTFQNNLSTRTSFQTDYTDLSTFPVSYNGWGQDCGELHCGIVHTADGLPLARPCTVLAFCDQQLSVTVTGFAW